MAAANFRGRADELRLILIKDKHPRSTRRRDALSRPTSTYNRPERLVRVSFCPLSPPSLSLCLTIVAVSPCCSPLVFLFLSSSVRSVVVLIFRGIRPQLFRADYPTKPRTRRRKLQRSNEVSERVEEMEDGERLEKLLREGGKSSLNECR